MRVVSTSGRAPTPEELREAKRLADLSRNALPRTREAAEKWRNGVLGMVGIITAITVLKEPTSLTTLPTRWQVGILALVASAVAAAIVSLALAMLASFGWPSPHRLASVTQLARWEADEARRTVARLRWSMVTALVFITLFVGGLGVASLAPTAKPRLEVVRTDGTTTCGDRLEVTAVGVTLRTYDTDVAIPAAQIGAVRPVAKCGGG